LSARTKKRIRALEKPNPAEQTLCPMIEDFLHPAFREVYGVYAIENLGKLMNAGLEENEAMKILEMLPFNKFLSFQEAQQLAEEMKQKQKSQLQARDSLFRTKHF